MSMSLRENITAVIETCFSETKDEIQDTAINRILELIRADRNSSEKPNNCETCRHWWVSEEVCLLDDCQYEPEMGKKFPRRTEKPIRITWVDEDLNELGKTES